MSKKVLFVDDDPLVLSGFNRKFGKEFSVTTARGPQEGLKALRSDGPFAVAVVDYQMPVMDGIQFLANVRQSSPDTVRMMLTGNADLEVAMEAVNTGEIFRFLTKPCPARTMVQVLNVGIRQHQLLRAERELIEKTLKGSVEVITDILSLASPAAFSKASRVGRIMTGLAEKLRVLDPWEFEVAGMLSLIGVLTLPSDLIEKTYNGEDLIDEEQRMFETHAETGHDLLIHIPRFQNVAEMIAYQNKNYDGTGSPENDRKEKDIPMGARALHVALDYDTLVSSGMSGGDAINAMAHRNGRYDHTILDALAPEAPMYESTSVMLDDLEYGMILADHIPTLAGSTIVAKGQRINQSSMARLTNIHKSSGIREPIEVLIPREVINGDKEEGDR